MDVLLAVQGKVLERGVVRGQAVIRWYLGMSRQVIIQREVFTRVRWSQHRNQKKPTACPDPDKILCLDFCRSL